MGKLMSERLYYWDAYLTQFTGHVIEVLADNGRSAVVLNQTCFYPTSGGQPHDTGLLGNTAVTDVTLRESDGAVLHWLEAPLPHKLDTVDGRIQWPRRFDHMQQHSGQHILSQAFIRVADAPTIGFHLSADSVTIDLDTGQVTSAQLAAAEALANQVVWENRPIQAREVTQIEARRLNLRKIPDAKQGKLRLIDIENFDLTACGGTHVSRTGAVGLIKILRLERIRGQARVVFCCGGRALADYNHKHDVLQEIGVHLTTSYAEFPQTVQSLQETLKQANRAYKQQTDALLALEAQQLLMHNQHHEPYTLIAQAFAEKDAGQLRLLANHLTQNSGVVALLGVAGEKSFLLFSRSADAPGDMRHLLQEALQKLGGRGGGTAVTAQGGGAEVLHKQLQTILNQAKEAYLSQIS